MEPIKCGNCGTSNPPDARFCTKCGSPLAFQSSGPQPIENEIRHLRQLVNHINSRLDTLEGRQSQAAVPQSIPASRPVEPITVAPEPVLPRAPVKHREWEQILGGNWLARIGILALIIGIGFFLKYAFDNNWIGPTARVVLGGIAGLVMVGLGYYWRKRYPILTQVLNGGGIAVFYLSVFASFATYHLINIYIATVLLLVISVLATLLALHYNSIALSIIGIFGAYFAPFILGAFSDTGRGTVNTGQAIQLLVYIIVIDLGVLMLSAFRSWRWFNVLALACSLITYGFWHGEFSNQISIATAEIGITTIFLIFTGATAFFHLMQRRTPRAYDYILLIINAAAYGGISLGLMWHQFRGWLGGFLLLAAVFYGVFSYFTHKRSTENAWLGKFSLAIALVFLTIAIPVQFRDHAVTTILWAAEMAVCVWLSFILKISYLRYFSYAVFITMVWRLLLFDTTVSMVDFRPIINERFLAYIIAIAAAYLTVYVLWRRGSIIEWHFIAPFLLIITSFISLWLISFEVWDSFSNAIRSADRTARASLGDAQNLSLTAVWAVYAVAGLIIGIKKHWRHVRIGSLVLLVIPIAKVFVYDVFKLEMSYRIVAFVGLGVLLLTCAYLYQRYSRIIKGVFTEK